MNTTQIMSALLGAALASAAAIAADAETAPPAAAAEAPAAPAAAEAPAAPAAAEAPAAPAAAEAPAAPAAAEAPAAADAPAAPAAADATAAPAAAPAAAAVAVQDDKADWTVSQITQCASNNLVGKGALRDLTVMPTDREGKSRTLKMRFFWKPTERGEPRVNLRLTHPLPVAGSSYLMTMSGAQEDVYFYFPGADRALKITGKNMSEPLWGTDVSYGEIKQVLGVVLTKHAMRKADADVGNRKAFVLEVNSSEEETGYSKVVSYIGKQSCVLLKADFYGSDSKPRKTLVADLAKILEADSYWLALGYTMNDLKRGTKTVLDLSDFSVDERLPERMFDSKRFFEPYN